MSIKFYRLDEMAATQTCGNCHQKMSGNHFYRRHNGQSVRYCKTSAINQAKAEGHSPKGNRSFPLGGQPPVTTTNKKTTRSGTGQESSRLNRWLADTKISKEKVNILNGKLHVNQDVFITHQHYKRLPVPFGKVQGDFTVLDLPHLEDFTNFPTHITGHLELNRTGIKSLDGLEHITVDEGIHLFNNPDLVDFHNAHKKLHNIKGRIMVELPAKAENVLGLFMTKNANSLVIEIGNTELDEIFKDHAHRKKDNRAVVVDLQDQLIDAGREDLANI